MADYDRRSAAEAFRRCGLKPGDTVFTHSNVGYFGEPEGGRTAQNAFQTLLDAFFEVLGPTGTLVVPVFTYSFPKDEVYDPAESSSACGVFSESLRKHPAAKRSDDPIFSVAALGHRAEELTRDVPGECFGPGSFWDRFHRTEGVICNLNLDAAATIAHFFEKKLGAPYRQDRTFAGVVRKNGVETRRCVVFYSHDLNVPDTRGAFERFDTLARARGMVRTATIGRGAAVAITAADTLLLIRETLPKEPYFLTRRGQASRASTRLVQ